MNMTTTTNGMAALQTSFSRCVDLFGKIGSARGVDLSQLIKAAIDEDIDVALRILLWARDIRGGSGERETFRKATKQMASMGMFPELCRFVPKIPELGRWDDLFVLIGLNDTLDGFILEEVAQALVAKNGLCAKWLPRKGPIAAWFTKKFELTPKSYRKMVVGLTNVVETQMCNKKFAEIEFGKVPSIASARYQRAFGRNAPAEYGKYLDSLKKGEAKVNAGAIFPYDIIRNMGPVSQAQWESLPNYLEGNDENIMALIDVSGSMMSPAAANVTCMDVAISLGLYLAERTKGIFKDKFITFETNPHLIELSPGSLNSRVYQIRRAPWGGSTDFEAVFKLILNSAKKAKLAPELMPTKLFVFSDMQFNAASGNKFGLTAVEMLDKMYADAGYKRPQMVFWNLDARRNNVPTSYAAGDTALVSGFSPALMKSLLGAKDFTPKAVMLDTVMSDRYSWA